MRYPVRRVSDLGPIPGIAVSPRESIPCNVRETEIGQEPSLLKAPQAFALIRASDMCRDTSSMSCRSVHEDMKDESRCVSGGNE